MEARFYKRLSGNSVLCVLCANRCTIKEGDAGKCRVRKNMAGTLVTLVYGKIVSSALDPIEKKPLFHFLPGTKSFSVATVGCNFKCLFCQNWEIAHEPRIIGEDTRPKDVVGYAEKCGAKSISYTYTEPTVFYEFAYDTAKLAKKKGLGNVFVTNGYMSEAPLAEISPYLDAANVDLKSMSDSFYRKICGVSSVKPVLQTIRRMHDLGIHVEITNLVIPGLNDKNAQIKKLSSWVKSVDPDIPVHFTAYYPAYMMDAPPTPKETLFGAHRIAKKQGLNYVYLGNIGISRYADTLCPKCGTLLIHRKGYDVKVFVRSGRCFVCGSRIPVIA